MTEGNPVHLKPELFNNPGHKASPLNHFACGNYWMESAMHGCSVCVANCVFSKLAQASVHETVKAIIATTPLLNGFFYNMDGAFGLNRFTADDCADWWDNPDKWQPLHNWSTNY